MDPRSSSLRRSSQQYHKDLNSVVRCRSGSGRSLEKSKAWCFPPSDWVRPHHCIGGCRVRWGERMCVVLDLGALSREGTSVRSNPKSLTEVKAWSWEWGVELGRQWVSVWRLLSALWRCSDVLSGKILALHVNTNLSSRTASGVLEPDLGNTAHDEEWRLSGRGARFKPCSPVYKLCDLGQVT